MESSSGGSGSSGYSSVWDSSAGYSITIGYNNLTNGSTDFSVHVNYNGNTFGYSSNSAQQLGSFIVGGAVGATVIGLGGPVWAATAVGFAAKYGYSKLWSSGRQNIQQDAAEYFP